LRHLFIFILTTLTLSFALEAANVPGYIIKNSSDTVWGEMKVSPFSRIKGSFNLNGPETGSYYFGVVFRENSDSDFVTYYPASLQGFSFQLCIIVLLIIFDILSQRGKTSSCHKISDNITNIT
jgi:hypothetical protein